MSTLEKLAIGVALVLGLWALAILALTLVGRREDARAMVGLLPGAVALCARLLRDRALPRRRRALLAALLVYLALPIDLVPDFIPVAGQLDDAILVLLVLRAIVRASPDRVVAQWRGSDRSLSLLLRLVGVAARPPTDAQVGLGDPATAASSSSTTRPSSSAIGPGSRSA